MAFEWNGEKLRLASGQASRIRQPSFLSRHTNIGIVFLNILRLWRTRFWVDCTMNMAWWPKLHEFLRGTAYFCTLPTSSARAFLSWSGYARPILWESASIANDFAWPEKRRLRRSPPD